MTALRRAAQLEHRLTRPSATLADLDAAAALVLEHGLASLVVSPWLVKPAARLLARSGVRVATVVGFPDGTSLPAVKAFEASEALEHGAVEVDFVLNAGALASGDDDAVVADILAVVEMAHSGMALAGVTLAHGTLGEELVHRACRLAARAGVDSIITSTGEATGASTIERTAQLQRVVGGQLAVKAAGAFENAEEVWEAVRAGAMRVSTAFGRELLRDAVDLLSGPAADRAPSPRADVGVAAGQAQ